MVTKGGEVLVFTILMEAWKHQDRTKLSYFQHNAECYHGQTWRVLAAGREDRCQQNGKKTMTAKRERRSDTYEIFLNGYTIRSPTPHVDILIARTRMVIPLPELAKSVFSSKRDQDRCPTNGDKTMSNVTGATLCNAHVHSCEIEKVANASVCARTGGFRSVPDKYGSKQ